MHSPQDICLYLYRRLARAYPHEFRMIYGEDLYRLGEDAVPEVWRQHGLFGLLRLLVDIALHLPAEYLAELRQDVIYSLRVLVRSPGFTAVGVSSLAIGIGMCGVILCGSKAILGPLPGARDPDALVTPRRMVSYPYFEHYRDQRQVTGGAAAFLLSVPFAVAPNATRNATAERFYGHLVSPEYFSTLGVTPAAGRFFGPETEKPGTAPVVVVSDRFWRSYLNADPRAVGRTLRLNGQLATIVGIGPPDFYGMWPFNPADIFVPLTTSPALAPELTGDPLHRGDLDIFHVVMRLPDGVTIPAADAALDAVTQALDQQSTDPAGRHRDPKSRQLDLMPAGTMGPVTPELRTFMYAFNFVLWAVVLSLLCANLANLLLARASQRRREIAVRLSVGASRARLVRQFLTESILLSLFGGFAGVGVAYGIGHVFSVMPVPSPTPMRMDLYPDFRVLAFTLTISGVAGMVFGLAPALSTVRTDIGLALKEGAQTAPRGYRRFGLRNLFLASQVAASLVLLLMTGFMVTGYQNTIRLDPGFDTADLSLFSIDPVRDGYSTERSASLFTNLRQEISRVTGVKAVALAGGVPFANLSADRPNTRVSTSNSERDNSRRTSCAVFRERIGVNYFATLGVPMVRGHEFERRDQENYSPPGAAVPAILNQSATAALFGSGDPIGRLIREDEANYTVVGVAPDVRSGILPPKPVATVFLPLTAPWFVSSGATRATLLVRGTPGAGTLAAVHDELSALHSDLTVFDVQTMRGNLDRLNSFVQWSSAVYLVLGLFALLLACVGLGGVTAYAVAQRRKEIGIRMALGARGAQVRRLVLREGVALLAAGSLLGIASAFAISRAAASVTAQLASVFQTRTNDPRLIVGAPLLLAGLTLLACYLPARRATRIDPAVALREE